MCDNSNYEIVISGDLFNKLSFDYASGLEYIGNWLLIDKIICRYTTDTMPIFEVLIKFKTKEDLMMFKSKWM